MYTFFLVSSGSYCSVTLPQGAVGWSEVCDCGISWSCSLTIFVVLSVLSSFVIVLMRERERAGSLPICILSFWCLVAAIVLWLFLKVPWVGRKCVIVVLPDQPHLLFWLNFDVMWLLLLCVSSSRCRGLVYSVIVSFPDDTQLLLTMIWLKSGSDDTQLLLTMIWLKSGSDDTQLLLTMIWLKSGSDDTQLLLTMIWLKSGSDDTQLLLTMIWLKSGSDDTQLLLTMIWVRNGSDDTQLLLTMIWVRNGSDDTQLLLTMIWLNIGSVFSTICLLLEIAESA